MDVGRIPACSLGPLSLVNTLSERKTVDWKKKGRTHFSDDRHEAIYGDGPVEDYLGYHSVLAHKVAEL
jgi:hypothetical protein